MEVAAIVNWEAFGEGGDESRAESRIIVDDQAIVDIDKAPKYGARR